MWPAAHQVPCWRAATWPAERSGKGSGAEDVKSGGILADGADFNGAPKRRSTADARHQPHPPAESLLRTFCCPFTTRLRSSGGVLAECASHGAGLFKRHEWTNLTASAAELVVIWGVPLHRQRDDDVSRVETPDTTLCALHSHHVLQ